MPSYFIAGASRGIGWEFLRQLSADKNNIVVGLVRDATATEARVKEELSDRSNVTIVKGDFTDYDSLKAGVSVVEKATGGKLDYLIANGAYMELWTPFRPFETLGQDPKRLTETFTRMFQVNVLGYVHIFNLYMPLILKGDVKKVFALTSGHSDYDVVQKHDIPGSAPYAAMKAATNMLVAKYSTEYHGRGVLFLSVAPGLVETNGPLGQDGDETTQEFLQRTMEAFSTIAPGFRGPEKVEKSVSDMLAVFEKATVEDPEWRGNFVSQFGNKQWL